MNYGTNYNQKEKKNKGFFDPEDASQSSLGDNNPAFADKGWSEESQSPESPPEKSPTKKSGGDSEIAGAGIMAAASTVGGLMAMKAQEEENRKKMMLEAERQSAETQSKAQETGYNLHAQNRKSQMDLLKDIYLRKNRGGYES